MEQKVLEVKPKSLEKIVVEPVSQKILFAGVGLEEALAIGVGSLVNTPFMDVGWFIGWECNGTQMNFIQTINNDSHLAILDITGTVEGVERKMWTETEFYKELVSNTKAALIPYSKAIVFDLMNLGIDIPLLLRSKGPYRKAMEIKTLIDGLLLLKDVGLRTYLIEVVKRIIHSVARPESNPYPSEKAAIEAVYNMKNELISFLQNMRVIGEYQLPLSAGISIAVGVIALIWAYRRTRKESMKGYVTNTL